ncbi:MAG: HAMP domain-containing histidine kinase [Clostridiales bacterium]|nr:HAMP domain-containing histidine kinase [Clostridiales bacterium]
MRWRIFVAMLIFTGVVLLLLWGIQRFFLQDIYKAVKVSNVGKAIESITESVNTHIATEGMLTSIVEDNATKYDSCISVWDKKFNQTVSVCVNRGCRVHSYGIVGAAYFYKKAKDNGGDFVQLYGRSTPSDNLDDLGAQSPPLFDDDESWQGEDDFESIMHARIILDASGKEHLLLINSVLTPLNSVKRSFGAIFAIVGSVMVLFSVVASAVLSSFVVDPIYNISQNAKKLGKGDYSVRFEGGSYSEVVQLADALNYAASELSGVENMRRELMANVSHDLRTPLTLISGYAEMMKDFPGEDNKDNLQVIIDEASHMILLVNDMADVSKYNAGVQKLQESEFDLTATVKETAKRIALLHNNEYKIVFDPEFSVTARGDELKITQVLYNLINNAITHTGSDMTVTIEQTVTERLRQKTVEIGIVDSGDGISAEDIKTIWNRYYKMDKTYKRAHNGSGLGLNIVKSILELHNAEFGVLSRDQMPANRGCKFWFRLPITKKM